MDGFFRSKYVNLSNICRPTVSAMSPSNEKRNSTFTVRAIEINVDRWMFCLKNIAKLTERPAAVQGKIFRV